jgi:nucleotide-binding universal stress UspA family protein
VGKKYTQDIKRIIIPVDNSETSRNVARRGAFLAKLLGVSAKVINVDDTHQFIASVVVEEKLKKEAEAFLESFKKIGEEIGINIETELISGDPAKEIVKFANEDDLIVIADHHRKGIDRFMLGSISEEVIRNAHCSVLVVKLK